MGLLVDGVWHDQWYDTFSTGGRFVRSQAQFRNWVTADGQAGPTGREGFKAESGRYHLYVSLACPWASRTLMMRKFKDLEDHISLSVVHPLMLENGWTFEEGPGVIQDSVNQSGYMYQVYLAADQTYSGRVTVPVLWDKKLKTIVSNESSDIIRMMNTAFDHITGNQEDFYPEDLRPAIDEINDFIYPNVNNGVYRAGFATSQEAYEEAVAELFGALEVLEGKLGQSDYLVGNQLTEADIRLFTTLIRFDAVYYGHFKCSLKALREFPKLQAYTKRIYQLDGIKETVNFDHIKQHYYGSHKTINPTGVVPVGPEIDWES